MKFRFYRLLKEEYCITAKTAEEAKKKLEEAEDPGEYQVGLFLHNDDETFYFDGTNQE